MMFALKFMLNMSVVYDSMLGFPWVSSQNAVTVLVPNVPTITPRYATGQKGE